jgi:hypothetical protein
VKKSKSEHVAKGEVCCALLEYDAVELSDAAKAKAKAAAASADAQKLNNKWDERLVAMQLADPVAKRSGEPSTLQIDDAEMFRPDKAREAPPVTEE